MAARGAPLYRGSLALRVLGIAIAVIVLPLIVFSFLLYHQQYTNHLEETVLRLHDLGKSRATLLSTLTSFDFRSLQMIEEAMFADQLEQKSTALSALFERIAQGLEFATIFYISLRPEDAYLATAASNPEILGQDFSADPHIQRVIASDRASFFSYGSAMGLGPANKQYYYVAKLVHDPSSAQPVGILALSTPADKLLERLITSENIRYKVDFSLVTADGVIFASGNSDLLFHTLKPVSAGRIRELEISHELQPRSFDTSTLKLAPIPELDSMYFTLNGVKKLAVLVPVEGTDLTLMLTTNEHAVFQRERQRLLHVVGFFLLIFAVGGWAALWLTQRMSLPMRHFTDVMSRVKRGDLTARYRKKRLGFETNLIGDIFNQTIDSLREQMTRAESERLHRETLDQEFRIGREMQMSILPQKSVSFPGTVLCARYLPAKQVGGDFYDIFARPAKEGGEELILTVADASGKGISACLYSLLLRSMLRSFATTYTDISEAIRQANNLFLQDTGATGMFVTAFVALYEPKTRSLSYSSCGHLPALLVRSDGSIELLGGEGLALGIVPMKSLEERKAKLHPGDLLLLYSDGVTEAHNPRQELFGEARLFEAIKHVDPHHLEKVADGLLAAVAAFRGAAPQYDDITLLLMRVQGD